MFYQINRTRSTGIFLKSKSSCLSTAVESGTERRLNPCMFAKLSRFFQKKPAESGLDPEDLELASAILLVEVVLADYEKDHREIKTSHQALCRLTGMNLIEVEKLLATALAKRIESPSIFPYIRALNEYYPVQGRRDLLCEMWKVAMCDGHIDKHEEYIIRRVSGLLHLEHSDFINAKREAAKDFQHLFD